MIEELYKLQRHDYKMKMKLKLTNLNLANVSNQMNKKKIRKIYKENGEIHNLNVMYGVKNI